MTGSVAAVLRPASPVWVGQANQPPKPVQEKKFAGSLQDHLALAPSLPPTIVSVETEKGLLGLPAPEGRGRGGD